MIQYHGTPIGGKRDDAIRFLCGKHALVSFAHPSHLDVVMECSSSFILDNGAFTVWKQGGKLDVPGYVRWCEDIRRHPGFDWAIIPDSIEGGEEENDAMLSDWPSEIPGVPVFHLHESLDRAERLSSHPIVALGSSGSFSRPGTREWWARMNEVRLAFCDSEGRPRCKLHGLRMLDPQVFSWLPLHSADSTNCGRNSLRNGKAIDERFSQWQGATLTAWRIERHNSSATWLPYPLGQSSGMLFDTQDYTKPTGD